MSQRFGAHGEELSTPRWRPIAAVFLAMILHLALFSMIPSCEEEEEKKTEISLLVEESPPLRGLYAGTYEEVVTGRTETSEPVDDFSHRSVPSGPPSTAPTERNAPTPRSQSAAATSRPATGEPVANPSETSSPAPPTSVPAETQQEPLTEEQKEKQKRKKLLEELTKKGFFLREDKKHGPGGEPPDLGEKSPFGQQEDPIGFGHSPAPSNEPMGTGAEGGGRIMGGPSFDFWSGDEHTAEIGRARSEFERDWAEFQKWKHTDLGHGIICNLDGEWFVCGKKTIEQCNRAHKNMCRYARKKEREFLSDATIF